MAIVSNFKKIIARYESLKHVYHIILPELPKDISAVKTEFSESAVFIAVDENDDTLYVVPQLPDDLTDGQTVDVSACEPWKNVIGKPVRWVWELKNNQGYSDGIQFEFAANIKDRAIIIQMMGIASRISLRTVSEIGGQDM